MTYWTISPIMVTGDKMKDYTIKLDDDLSRIYEDIAKVNHKSIEETLQIILKRVIETMIKENTE